MQYRKRYNKIYADLETTVYEEQTTTEAWSSAFVGRTTGDPVVHTTLEDSLKWLKKQKGNLLIYYHNLKFDGFFWIDFFERYNKFKLGTWDYYETTDSPPQERLKPVDKLQSGEYTYRISAKGQWYAIFIKHRNRIIEMRDSLKLIPFRLEDVGKSFNTVHRKLTMDYTCKEAGQPIPEDKKEYIYNDVYVLQEALEKMEEMGYDKLTIGSCCLAEFKKHHMGAYTYSEIFPNLYNIKLGEEYFRTHETNPVDMPLYGYNVGSYLLRGYKGAFCDVGEGKANILWEDGYTLDVTSLYSSVMHSISGNYYPVGRPRPFIATPETDVNKLLANDRFYYYFRFRCTFEVKPGKIPFVQIKGDYRYKATEHLKTSDWWDPVNKKYQRYVERDGVMKLHKVELTMCEDELRLFFEHYNVKDFELLDGMFFYKEIGLFDSYIDHFFEIKSDTDDPVLRTLAKLFLNNLYGKFATTPDSSYKILRLGADDRLHFKTVLEIDKEPGYIAIGAAITAKARCFTIRAAQANKEKFLYADTDSLHLQGKPEEAKGVVIAHNKLNTWKLEGTWEYGYYTRQKTYIEKMFDSDGNPTNDYNIICAGMNTRCKNNLRMALIQDAADPYYKKAFDANPNLDKEELEFIKERKHMTDFKVGLKVPGKLKPEILPGGIVLKKMCYEMCE